MCYYVSALVVNTRLTKDFSEEILESLVEISTFGFLAAGLARFFRLV